MAQILVRNLDEDVVARLKAKAKKQGRSLQAEVKLVLTQAAETEKYDPETARKVCEAFARKFKGRKFPDSVELIREDRDR